MVDMSHYDEAENLEKTRVLTKECHARGIAVEAESGRIEGGEEGIADTGDLEGTYHRLLHTHPLYPTLANW
jgi:fructose-bisphosphate aldolase class II